MNSNNNNNNTRHVVIAGAGPSGLLLANLLLKRNEETTSNDIKYKVTLIESRIDVGVLDIETELKQYRSWMIGLAGHGLEAIRTIPELYKDYVLQPHVGVRVESFGICLGSKQMKSKVGGEEGDDNEGYVVDRNYVVAAIARYMDDKHKKNSYLTRRYETKLLYVDSENHRVMVRDNKSGRDEYINYDLLVGADGARSVVREALVKDNYDFSMDVGDIFQLFRAVHVARPKDVDPASTVLFPECMPHMTGISLPMPGDLVNISIGVPRNEFDNISDDLKSDDPKVVAEYFRKNFKPFELADYDDFAEKWIANGRWNRTSMVHCSTYHSMSSKIIIVGDSAHATSPSIGMGMNTALRDAQKFYELLIKHEDDLGTVLPAFSEERVKEGNALTDLAFHLNCLDTKVQLWETLHTVIRSKLNIWFPSLVNKHPQQVIGNTNYTLTQVYQMGTDVNVIPKHRAINDRIRQEFFEEKAGMITKKEMSGMRVWLAFLSLAIAAAACWYVSQSKAYA